MRVISGAAPRVLLRVFSFLGMVLLALGLCAAIRLLGRERLRPAGMAGWWSRRALGILGIDLQITGAGQQGRSMVICNHVSWLDILILAAAEEPHFVAKSEIANWPLVGWIATTVETFYIRRGRGGSRPLLNELVPWLRRENESFAVFPEGTTTDGQEVLPMHARLFAAAVEAGVPVQPVALRYAADARGNRVAPFIGDDTLFAHILRVLSSPGFRAELIYGQPQQPHCPVELLAWRSEQEVRRCLGLLPRELNQAA